MPIGAGGKEIIPCKARRAAAAAALALAALAWPAPARPAGCALPEATQAGTVTAVSAGGTLTLDTGQAARPAGLIVPLAPAPVAETVRRAIAALVAGRKIALAPGAAVDRHGRIVADIILVAPDEAPSPERWLQLRLAADGLARVAPIGDNRACIRALLAAEDAARAARRGLWRVSTFAVRAADRPGELNSFIDTFQIIEGRPVSIGTSRGRVYLNFGRRWKTDFTGFIAARDAARLAAAGHTPGALEGRRLRLRGYLEAADGPFLRLTHPDQIELIPDGAR